MGRPTRLHFIIAWHYTKPIIKYLKNGSKSKFITITKSENYKMKAVILAGGFGTRLSEETVLKPKPMVEIENKPIIWHIMKFLAIMVLIIL